MIDAIDGKIVWISGPAIKAKVAGGIRMYTVAVVGEKGVLGEIIEIKGDIATIQVYEDTTGLKRGEKVAFTGLPLSVELGPGLLGNVFDGIQRPLMRLKEESGDFIKSGLHLKALDREKKWDFVPCVTIGGHVDEGDIIGFVEEAEGMQHKIMVPNGMSGVVKDVKKGKFSVDESVVVLEDGKELTMLHKWPVRAPRPCKKKLPPDTPFITGQRVIDTFFPVSEGGSAIIPGGFGTGKTVTEQTLAKYSMADIIIYVGCGERGNEMSELLKEFPDLIDPATGKSLMSRTVIIVNTSNMPVAAREASIYTGVTVAEYFRDMGYHVAVFSDSTSRWAEALREISSRMEELPGEEGYPSYLSSRLSGFYERAGKVVTNGSKEREGSVTIVGAVSPPGGDFSEPVTQASLKLAGTFWALDTGLAYSRHFPAINWKKSYSLYLEHLKGWFVENVAEDWSDIRDEAIYLLHREEELREVVQLIGSDALQDSDRIVLEVFRLLKDGFLRQNAFSKVDAFCSKEKQYWMLKAILIFYNSALEALKGGLEIEKILKNPAIERILRMSEIQDAESVSSIRDVIDKIEKGLGE